MSEKSNIIMEMAENPEDKSLNPNEVDAKANNERSKSSLKYFLDLLSDSVVTGVPQIVTVSNLLRRIFKILVLGACIGGFIYQAVEFMKLYQTYPSSLEIEVKYSRTLPAPAITICNRNPVRRQEFCKERKELCAKPTNLTRFCKMYPHHCKENTTLDDLEFVVSNVYIDEEDADRFGSNAENLIEECCSAFFPFGDMCRKFSKKLVYQDEDNLNQNCYVIDFAKLPFKEASFRSLDEAVAAGIQRCLWWSPAALEQTFSVMVNLDHKEVARPDNKASVQAVVHSSDDLKNPFQKGFTMEEGKQYIVIMKAYEENLLPAPYSTNCTDSEKLDENYNREKCIQDCVIQRFIDKCDCLPSFLIFVSDDDVPICSESRTAECIQSFGSGEACFRQCPRLCHSFYFEYEVSSSNFEESVKAVNLGDGPVYKDGLSENLTNFVKSRENNTGEGRAFLKAVYSKNEVTVFTYKPKYEQIEILGYIGGFSGIWLGVSLVAIFDFFETVIVFFWFLAKRAKEKKDYGGR